MPFPRAAAGGTPPPPPGQGPSSPPPPPTQVSLPDTYVFIDGKTVSKTGAELATMPPDTQVYHQERWVPLSTLLGGATPPPPAATGFGGRSGNRSTKNTGRRFAGVAGAEIYHRNAYIQEGSYVIRVASVDYKEARNANFLIVEGEVIISSYDPNNPASLNCNREGSAVSIMYKENDSFNSNMKELIWAVSGLDAQGQPRPQEDPSLGCEDECEQLVSEDQPARGAHIAVRAQQVTTRSGGDYTRCNFYPCGTLPDGSPDPNSIPW